jgi:8-oxo-dGTP pyrophosphatase MutT (NUDIX family)
MPHRNSLLSLIADYRLLFPHEVEQADRLQEFVSCHSDCFSRELSVGHITGSAWVIDESGTRTLLTHHRKLNKWLQPGGHADGVSDVADVAMKEAEEETGLENLRLVARAIFDIDIHSIPQRKNEPQHFHYDCRFLIQCGSNDQYAISSESNDLAWVKMSELSDYTTEVSVTRLADKCASFRLTK